MARTTKAHVESAFKALAEACGKRIATSYNDVGAWRLDYMPGYGGYNIEEIRSETGGIGHPISSQRLSASAAYDAYWFAVRAIEISRKGAYGA